MSTRTTITNTSTLSTPRSSSHSDEEVSIVVDAAAEAEEPAVPFYTDEQLELLVREVKHYATLTDVQNDVWNVNVENVIKDYFLSKSAWVLSIYLDDVTLAAALGPPTVPVKYLIYFMKDPTDVITPENFCEFVTFGTATDSIEGAMLDVLQYVYSPRYFMNTSWPNDVKHEFSINLHDFLSFYIDTHYRLRGSTVMYVPQESLSLSVEEASKDKNLVRRLEGVTVYWIRQIRAALSDKEWLTYAEGLCPFDEYELWTYRYKNLVGLDVQLQDKSLNHICDILLMNQSTYICQFLSLAEEIKEGMHEAKSNIDFLQILKDPCDELDKTISPADIPKIIPTLLQNIRVIWINSPYYNTREKLSALCRLISNQVILQCTRAVNLECVFQGNTRAGIKIFENITECCLKYRFQYNEIAETHSKSSHIPWDIDNGPIFNQIDSFVQRCKDMIEICEAMIIFGRMDETENVSKPHFGGTRGEDFENICENVERSFAENLQAIRDVQQNILDVKASSWCDAIIKFRGQMKDIEVKLKNLMVSVFEQVVNVEEGVLALQAFYHYSKRDALHPLYVCKTVAVYKLFSEEIQYTKKDLVKEKTSCPVGLPPFAGRALMTRLKKRHFMRLMKILDDAQWLPPCGMEHEVHTQYEKLMESMENVVRDVYQKWNDSLDGNMDARLDRPLMVKSHRRPGLLKPNLDRVILNVCCEAREWERLKFGVPSVIQSVYKKWDKLKLLYERVLTVVLDYNQIIEALSDEETELFRELIEECDKKINCALLELKWNTDVSDVYIYEFSVRTSQLQDFVDDFKKSNLEIVSICEEICDTSFIHVDNSHVYELKELDYHLTKCREEAMTKILAHYKHIIQCVGSVYEGFEEYKPLTDQCWVSYINKMDAVIEEALKQCVRGSLQIMLEAVHEDGLAGPRQMLKVSTTFKNNTIILEPSLKSIESFIKRIFPDILNDIASIPCLVEKFASSDMQTFCEAVEKDEECNHLHNLLAKGVMVGMWKPEPPHEEYDENLFTAETGIVVVEQDSSDSEDEDAVHSGYQLLAQGPNDLNNTENEDDSVSADILPGSSVADVIVADPVDSEDAGASHVVLDQCNLENDRRAELKELWSGSSNANAIEMGIEQAERVRLAMEKFSLPPLSIPEWVFEVSEEQGKQQLLDRAKRLQQGD